MICDIFLFMFYFVFYQITVLLWLWTRGTLCISEVVPAVPVNLVRWDAVCRGSWVWNWSDPSLFYSSDWNLRSGPATDFIWGFYSPVKTKPSGFYFPLIGAVRLRNRIWLADVRRNDTGMKWGRIEDDHLLHRTETGGCVRGIDHYR